MLGTCTGRVRLPLGLSGWRGGSSRIEAAGWHRGSEGWCQAGVVQPLLSSLVSGGYITRHGTDAHLTRQHTAHVVNQVYYIMSAHAVASRPVPSPPAFFRDLESLILPASWTLSVGSLLRHLLLCRESHLLCPETVSSCALGTSPQQQQDTLQGSAWTMDGCLTPRNATAASSSLHPVAFSRRLS